MTLDDVKEQLQEKWDDLSAKVTESDTFIQMSERYNNLSPLVQRVIIGAIAFFGLYMVYSVPAGFIDAAKEKEARFIESRQLIRGLTRTARNPQVSPDQFNGLQFEDMRTKINGVASRIQVLETQKGAVVNTNNPLPASVVPKAIKQNGLTYEFKKLTLRQAVALGEQISSLHKNTKLAGVSFDADPADPHYFNVKYTLSSLSLPLKADQKQRK